MLSLNHLCVQKEIKKLKTSETFNKQERTTCPNLCDTMKTALRGKFKALRAYRKKVEKSHTSDFTAHLKLEEKRGILSFSACQTLCPTQQTGNGFLRGRTRNSKEWGREERERQRERWFKG